MLYKEFNKRIRLIILFKDLISILYRELNRKMRFISLFKNLMSYTKI